MRTDVKVHITTNTNVANELVKRRGAGEGNVVVGRRGSMGGVNGTEDTVEEVEEDNREYDVVRNSGFALLPLPALPTSQEQKISGEGEEGGGGGGEEGRGEGGEKSPPHARLAPPNTGGGGVEEGLYVIM